MSNGNGPLSGLTVLDLSRVFAAPYSTQMLSDLGAVVWKIEALEGDDSRRWGSHVFPAFNRGKKSIAANLKDPRGQGLVRSLAGRADIFVENFKADDLARYGLDYDRLRRENARLIYLSLTGFGQTGPRRTQPGYDTIMQAMTGIMSLTGEPNGAPGKVGVAWIDVMAGLVSTIGILAALHERQHSGLGQRIDLSLFEVGVMALVDAAQDYLQNGVVQARQGSMTRNISPAQPFEVADGWITIAIGNNDQFRRLCGIMGLVETSNDPRFATNVSRVAHRAALTDIIAPVFKRQSRSAWIQTLADANVPAGPIQNVRDALEDTQSLARAVVWKVPGSDGGPISLLANPLQHMSRTPARPAGPPPAVGEHTHEVLCRELGLDPAELAALAQDGVIRCCPRDACGDNPP